MKKPPIPETEELRLEALRFLELLDTGADERFDRITDLASRLIGVPICAVSLVDRQRQWFKSIQGLDVTETSRDVSFCGHAILDDSMFVVPDATEDERFEDNPLVTGGPEIRFYAGHPIKTSEGHRIGTLCVIDRTPRELSEKDRAVLADLAAIVEAEVHSLERLQQHVHRIEDARKRAGSASEKKASFLAHMSHEIRTPMMSILGYVDLLGDESTTEEDRREYTEIIRSSGEHLLALVNDILDHAKIESGSLDVENREVDLPKLLSDVHRLLKLRAEEKGLSFRLGVSGPVPTTIRTDPVRLRQILVNLVGNAIKFTEKGFISMVARVEHAPAAESIARGKLRIRVQDTGIGMTPEQAERVFEPFSQAEAGTTRKYGGTGLGLAISRQLSEKLGGELVVESRLGMGTTFELGIDPGDLEGVPTLEAFDITPVPSDSTDATPTFAGRVLIAEDDAVNRRLLEKLLDPYEIELDTVPDGGAAVRAVLEADRSGTPFDLVLMDMLMPVKDGYAATSEIRGGGFRGPIVALTGNTQRRDREKCLQSGCDDYLAKPIDRDALAEILGRYAEAPEPDSP